MDFEAGDLVWCRSYGAPDDPDNVRVGLHKIIKIGLDYVALVEADGSSRGAFTREIDFLFKTRKDAVDYLSALWRSEAIKSL